MQRAGLCGKVNRRAPRGLNLLDEEDHLWDRHGELSWEDSQSPVTCAWPAEFPITPPRRRKDVLETLIPPNLEFNTSTYSNIFRPYLLLLTGDLL